MSSFRFNFSGDNNATDVQDSKRHEQTEAEKIHWLDSVEVVPKNQIEEFEVIAGRAKMFVCGDVEIGHVLAKEALLRMVDDDSSLKNVVELAEKEHSDLITGKYEGGLKIWECTYDLIGYLTEYESDLKFHHLKVLDLGCGAGILGLYSFMNDAASVTFQDYNKEVLECVTIPNVLLNVDENERESAITKCKFYSGDWASFNSKLPETELYDIILTSETIYNPDNYDKLIELFLLRLRKGGTAYVAAKTCYFGVGGGTRLFEKSLENRTLLKSEVCWKSSSGGIQREILKVTRNSDLFIID